MLSAEVVVDVDGSSILYVLCRCRRRKQPRIKFRLVIIFHVTQQQSAAAPAGDTALKVSLRRVSTDDYITPPPHLLFTMIVDPPSTTVR